MCPFRFAGKFLLTEDWLSQHGQLCRWPPWRDQIQPDSLNPLSLEIQHSCRTIGNVNDSPFDDGPAVIDADNHAAAVPQIRDYY
jgi:hypothetical protein